MVRRRLPRRSETASPRRSLLETIPAWVQALTGIAALVATVLGIGAVTSNDQNGSPSPEPRRAQVWVVRSAIGPEEITGSGEYRGLLAQEEEVLLLVQVDGEGAWVPVEAQRTPDETSAGVEDGAWEARAPMGATAAVLQPVVVPVGLLGAGGEALEELASAGPEADFVIVAGDPVEAEAP